VSRRRPGWRAGVERGQATVEFALILPVVVVLLLAVVQVGQVVRYRVVVVHTAREVARAAAVAPTPPSVGDVGERHGLDPSRLRLAVTPPDAAGFVRVTVGYDIATDVALIGPLVPDVGVEATAQMVAEWRR
jgi:Flp pilus assembly pilin Flp